MIDNNYKIEISILAFKGLISCILLCTIPSCQVSKYADALLEENQNLLEKHKSLIKSLKFTGIISSKEKGKGKYKYRIGINMDTIFSQEITYLPYYEIKGSQLNIIVDKNMYQQLFLADTVLKENKSEFLYTKGRKLPLVSSEKYKWVPCIP